MKSSRRKEIWMQIYPVNVDVEAKRGHPCIFTIPGADRRILRQARPARGNLRMHQQGLGKHNPLKMES